MDAPAQLAMCTVFAIITQSLNTIQILPKTQALASRPVAAAASVASAVASDEDCARAKHVWALVPVKGLASAKQRLQHYLGREREELVLAMLTDVLDALASSTAVAQIAVVTADSQVAALVQQRGLLLVEETGNCEMNAAIALGVQAIRQNGGREVVIIPSDIPLLTGNELDRLAGLFHKQAGHGTGEFIAIGPSADRGGTNCLFLDAHQVFEFCYGPDSFALHCARAGARHVHVVSLDSPTVSMDVDEPGDLDRLMDYYRQHDEFRHTETWKFLHSRDRRKPAAVDQEV